MAVHQSTHTPHVCCGTMWEGWPRHSYGAGGLKGRPAHRRQVARRELGIESALRKLDKYRLSSSTPSPTSPKTRPKPAHRSNPSARAMGVAGAGHLPRLGHDPRRSRPRSTTPPSSNSTSSYRGRARRRDASRAAGPPSGPRPRTPMCPATVDSLQPRCRGEHSDHGVRRRSPVRCAHCQARRSASGRAHSAAPSHPDCPGFLI